MYFMERYCSECGHDVEHRFDCDEHIIEPCPDDCDLVQNSAEYGAFCTKCNGFTLAVDGILDQNELFPEV